MLLGLGRSTLYRAVEHGEVPFPVLRIGTYRYIPRAAIERLLAGGDSVPPIASNEDAAPNLAMISSRRSSDERRATCRRQR